MIFMHAFACTIKIEQQLLSIRQITPDKLVSNLQLSMHRIFKLAWIHVELLLSEDLVVQSYI